MESLERKHRITAVLLLIICLRLNSASGQRNSTKMSYVCPPEFIRLGHSCYYFSKTNATWKNALDACQDKDSSLSVPARWEDRNLRLYLNKGVVVKASRWIGGVYDYAERTWKWGGELRAMRYQSFSKMKKQSPEQLQWHCIAMMPNLHYRWSPRSCVEQHQYICQTKLQKVPKSKTKELKRRWERMGVINEIAVPGLSHEVNDPMMVNDVTARPVLNPKSYDLHPQRLPKRGGSNPIRSNSKNYDLRPNDLRKRSRSTAQSRLKRPFPGYSWNRRDPEGSFQRNAELLRSGRTGLSAAKIKMHLTRLAHLRDKQIARRNMRERDDWLVNDPPQQALARTHARTYTLDNNISALHPKMIVEEIDAFAPPPPSAAQARLARGAG